MADKSLRRRLLLIATIAAAILFSLHPELRLLIPLVDALGIDLLVMLLSAQIWSYVKPSLLVTHSFVVQPLAQKCYSAVIFFFGYGGPYVDARLAARFPRLGSAA